MAITHAHQEGRLRGNALIGLAAFGAGITWGAGVIGCNLEGAQCT
ncbi:MAG: 3-oxoacyl-[acyl-carrier-protein] synthase III C-terminal domain-containing protein [Pseudonocardiaceae bacterium]